MTCKKAELRLGSSAFCLFVISGKYKTILSDTIISIAIVQLTAACMVSAAMTEVEAGSKDKHVALVSKAYLVLLLHILVEKFILIHAAMRIEYE